MPIADILAGAASFAAILGGLLAGSALGAVSAAISGFVLIFLCSAAMGAAFPVGIGHLIGTSLLGVTSYIVLGLLTQRLGRMVVAGCLAACVIGGVLVAQLSGERAKSNVRGETARLRHTEVRALLDASINTTLNTFMAKPIEYAGVLYGYTANYAETGRLGFRENALHSYGTMTGALIKTHFPGDPVRRFEVIHIPVHGRQ
jgi:hypothetical protein